MTAKSKYISTVLCRPLIREFPVVNLIKLVLMTVKIEYEQMIIKKQSEMLAIRSPAIFVTLVGS